jgi:hypothetical protein
MTIDKRHVLRCYKALHFVPGLKESDRRLGAILLEHYNIETGRCDPGMDRLSELLGCSVRTVIRALARLEHHRLFSRDRHAGHYQQNAYLPIWQTFWDVLAAWKVRFDASKKRRLAARGMSPARCQPSADSGDTHVTETNFKNSRDATAGAEPASYHHRGLRSRDVRKGLPREARAPFAGLSEIGKAASVARIAAERSWRSDIEQRFAGDPQTRAAIRQAITDVLSKAATDAEIHHTGGGIAHIVEALASLILSNGDRHGE